MNKLEREESGGATSIGSSDRSQVSLSQAMGHTFIGPFIGCAVGGNNNSNEIFNTGPDDQLEAIGRELKVIKDDNLAKEIRRWLSPPDSSRNRNEADEKRQVDTCSWFLEGERFRHWEAKPGFLWVQGKAGSGKSVLCSSIINKLSEKNGPFGIAYFFFDGRDSQRDLQLYDKLIQSLIWQLSHQLGGIPTELADLYKRIGDLHQPSVKQLRNVLLDILGGFPHAYIVIDALDECTGTDIEKTLDWVNQLVSDTPQKVENLHMLITSRPEPDIKKVFEALDSHSIDIGEATTNQDIVKYLKNRIESKFKECDENIRREIESGLRERADGSFRWVALQLAELEKCASEDEIAQQMKNLPKGLDDIYERMLKAVDGRYHSDVMTFLEWLSFSKRPMEVAEIADTITVDFSLQGGPVFKKSKRYRNPGDMLKRCSGLVSESKGFVKLSHFSVKEYLLSGCQKDFSVTEEAAHLKIAKISVAYLLQFDSFDSPTQAALCSESSPITWAAPHSNRSSPLKQTALRLLILKQAELHSSSLKQAAQAALHSSPLAQYAAKYWINHTKFGRMDSTLLTLTLRLFTSETAPLTNWIRIYDIDANKELSMDKARVCPPLYYASLAGLAELSTQLVENQADVNAQGGLLGNPLQAASYRGHEVIVKLLLENGADVNAKAGLCGNALTLASSKGHEAIVKLLLENEADVNAQGGYSGDNNALYAASSRGYKAIVKVLLENGADVNVQGGRYGNALQAASFEGHEAIVKLLLENGADVNVQGQLYGNALQLASYRRHEAIVKLLLENGADVNATAGEYGHALYAASSRGHKAIVKLLLENGADVNATEGEYGNILQLASSEGNEAIVKLLLENGADVNATAGEYGNALQLASSEGKKAIVELLLENGADVNAQGGLYSNALQAASYRRHEAIVKLLLENGADVNVEGGPYGNTLQVASSGGHEAIVKLLLENGADVNATAGEYGHALYAASSRGHEAIVKLLLENGADVNAQDGNALQAASSNGHETVVKLLLENRADVNAMAGKYSHALYAASSRGHEAIVKLLLENGADVNAQDGNALQAASSNGHETVVKLLLENGADVNATAGEYGNALQAASSEGNKAIVELLLENGADVNAQGGLYGNALQVASYRRHEAIVKLLLENGADVNVEGGPCGNTLQVVSSQGHKAIVKLLLENGADVNATAGIYGHALYAASSRGHEAIVKLLLENGADVNAQDGNALQAASSNGHETVVKLLLENGAYMSMQ